MKAWGVYDDELTELAFDVGLRIRGRNGPKREGRAYRFRLALRERLPTLFPVRHYGHFRYQKLDRWLNGTSHVCWHGNREFLHALFQQFPEAIVDTAFARYHGLENFELLYQESQGAQIPGYVNTGGQCTCPTGVRQRQFWQPPRDETPDLPEPIPAGSAFRPSRIEHVRYITVPNSSIDITITPSEPTETRAETPSEMFRRIASNWNSITSSNPNTTERDS